VAPTNATVLITGESGVGKELIARAIYRHSLRKGQTFMAVNCAAIPESLLESELFGHEKGSFTGAAGTRKGKFEYCDEGTIFLDEIGDLPAGTQAKLLRVLQDGEFTRVGSNVPIRVNVRAIAATNKDLETEIESRRFREDLFYRLNVVRIEVPSLRERKEDIPPISLSILRKIAAQEDLGVVAVSQEAMQIFQAYSWPGNVRELENCIHRAAVLASGDTILPHHLPQSILTAGRGAVRSPKRTEGGIHEALDAILRHATEHPERPILDFVEHELLLRVLRETNGNQVQASRRLGMARATLRKRIEQLGLQKPGGR
jgi:transcriptional regulator with GAF, ATPase, and Fis domain